MKKAEFPISVEQGSATVKVNKTPCRGADRFTISYWLSNTRKRATYEVLDRAKTKAAEAATRIADK